MSLITSSYAVLYMSLAAHLCQFLFLGYVENPRTRHGTKTARPPGNHVALCTLTRVLCSVRDGRH